MTLTEYLKKHVKVYHNFNKKPDFIKKQILDGLTKIYFKYYQ